MRNQVAIIRDAIRAVRFALHTLAGIIYGVNVASFMFGWNYIPGLLELLAVAITIYGLFIEPVEERIPQEEKFEWTMKNVVYPTAIGMVVVILMNLLTVIL